MALESQVSPSNTTLRPFMGGTTSDLTGTCSPLGSCTSACGPSRMALCTASCKALPAVLKSWPGQLESSEADWIFSAVAQICRYKAQVAASSWPSQPLQLRSA